MLLNPFRKQLCWGAGQVCSQQHGWGCISLLNPLLPPPFPATLLLLAPAPLLACSLLTHCRIDQTSSHQRNAGVQPGAALCYSLTGSTRADILCLAREWFYLVPHRDPSACLNKWRKGKGTCPGPASDRDLLTRFCGCRPTLTRMQKRLALQSRAVRCRRWSQYPLKGYSKPMPG